MVDTLSETTLSVLREPLIKGERGCGQVSDEITSILNRKAGKGWWLAFALSSSLLLLGVVAVLYTFIEGIGVWGLNKTVGWGFDITNFVFWVGIGHAGTLISAILFLFREKWRTSVNRAAETMTIFAIICAGLFPLIHLGRIWQAFWIFPYPNFRGSLWVNFRSPLVWDVFAVSTYFIISLLFWYLGLLPDLATARHKVKSKLKQRLYRFLSLGWNGSTRDWSRYEIVYLLLAGLATPLVLSVHSVVGFDFATSIVPGWHSTIFPPYFVAGAIFSGLAMVLTLLIPIRRSMGLEDYITIRHLENLCKLIIVTLLIVKMSYLTEFWVAWYSGNQYEQYAFMNRAFGHYAWCFWTMIACNTLIPQLFWFKRLRTSVAVMFVISILINLGMWMERYVIVVTSLHRDFLPSSWAVYTPTLVEISILIGSFGLFFTCYLLFMRLFPVISMSEVKGVLSYGHGRLAPIPAAAEPAAGEGSTDGPEQGAGL